MRWAGSRYLLAWLSTVTVVLVGCTARSADLNAAYSVVDSVQLHDASRNRDIPLKIYLPSNKGPNPLIIFSHGFGGDKDGNVYLGTAWASAGYVVILPTHHGGDKAALLAKGFGAVRSGEAVSADQLDANAHDVSFIISSLDEIERSAPQFVSAVDRTRIGVAGHSMGAGTTLVLAGATLPGRTTTASDTRVRAFIAMSPQGTYSKADLRRWDGITRPTMTMYGSNDQGAQGQPSSWRREPFDHMPAGDKYNLVIDGANHFSFADKPSSPQVAQFVLRGQTTDIEQIHKTVVEATTLFWNAYLKGDSQAKSALHNLHGGLISSLETK